MKTVFDAATRIELVNRLGKLGIDDRALWGKMSASQMLVHCRLWEEMIHENKRYKRIFIGRIIGPMVLKQVLKGPVLSQNTPTIPEMVITGTDMDFENERRKLAALLASYTTYAVPDNTFVHPFFGTMTKAQIGVLAYMHLDHHLRQFGV